ncbi:MULTISPECIES: pyrroline-5-carboxylate reductase [Lactobacillus]|uniref:Pyrroline-5-carboxylate reductase n=1 Tax=Lactobacillus xujianguonis TaxID=2495899 RepID=A0A437SW56_9LACO|nr:MULTISPECIES: pyrroline-5-carboxylate reductase [Lactobacillus]RVU71143.1 pyrroline-5-carboxylate reductase [Lactobacillus xujianguonis]RVU77490.1 pyrroline-5-carboxylate reductase [Lactobacillus xujianguonis]
MKKVAIVGVGQMGSAIMEGLFRTKKYDLIGENPVNPRVDQLAEQFNFKLVHSMTDLANLKPDFIILTTPAKITSAVLKDLPATSSATIISAAAGISMAELDQILPEAKIARIIPNTPVAINAGTIATYLPEDLDETSKTAIKELLADLGDVIEVKEEQLSIAGTIGGCGPAFVDVFLDALADAGVLNGLKRDQANQIAASMVKGAATLALETKTAPALLRDQVCSPGGTTIKGVASLEKNGLRHAVIDAVNAANEN